MNDLDIYNPTKVRAVFEAATPAIEKPQKENHRLIGELEECRKDMKTVVDNSSTLTKEQEQGLRIELDSCRKACAAKDAALRVFKNESGFASQKEHAQDWKRAKEHWRRCDEAYKSALADTAGQDFVPRSILMLDTPWPLRDVVAKLTEAAAILFVRDHDSTGWEGIKEALDVANRWLAEQPITSADFVPRAVADQLAEAIQMAMKSVECDSLDGNGNELPWHITATKALTAYHQATAKETKE